MEKKITGYTTVDISQWHRKEHFEAFQSVAQCTYNQTVQLDITAFLKTVKKNKHKFYPAFIHILARLMNAHPEFRMAMKDGELVIWDSVHPCYTVFHEQTETFSSLWSEYHDDFRQFLHIYSQDVACYGENLAYFPKGFIENMFFVSANPWVSFTSFDLNVANMDNFFAPVFTMGKYYTQGDKVLMPLAIQVHHAVCDGFHVGRMLNELQQFLYKLYDSQPPVERAIEPPPAPAGAISGALIGPGVSGPRGQLHPEAPDRPNHDRRGVNDHPSTASAPASTVAPRRSLASRRLNWARSSSVRAAKASRS